MTDEQLREIYGRAITEHHDPRRAACPSPDMLLAVARREGPERERVAMLDHVMSCEDCRRDFELLRAIEQGRRAEAGEAVNRIRWRRPLGAALVTALAASVTFAVVLGPGHDRGRRGANDVVRSAPGDVIALAPAPDAVTPRAALAFTWRAVPGARSYTLEVVSPAGSTIASRQTTDTTTTLTDVLAPGEYRWWVRARLDGGEHRSPARRLRISG